MKDFEKTLPKINRNIERMNRIIIEKFLHEPQGDSLIVY